MRLQREACKNIRQRAWTRTGKRTVGTRNLALLGRIVATVALRRTESRGAHFRLDYPAPDDAKWRVVTRLEFGPDGELLFGTDPVKDAVPVNTPEIRKTQETEQPHTAV